MATPKKPKPVRSTELLLPLEEPSLLFAQRELIRTSGINFEQWWDEFKTGFVGGKRTKDSNFKTALWTKPKYANLTPVTSTSGAMTIEYWPDKNISTISYLFSGTCSDIIKGIMDVMRASTRINFEMWFAQWETGFPVAVQGRINGNYPLTGENIWRGDISKRPRWRQWSNDNGIITGEYWRDRSVEGKSNILSGTAEQLIQHIIQLEYEGGGSQQQSVSSDVIRYSGIPEITLFFRGVDKTGSTSKQQTFVKGDKSFRYMGYTDNPDMAQKREDLELITQADIKRIGDRIKTIFGTNPRYNWSKGKKQVVYHDWFRGYNLNVYASSHAEGERMVASILALRDLTIDETFIKYGEAKNPIKAYPPPTEIQVMGKPHKTTERLPNVDVTFEYAKIYLPTIKETQYIA